MGPCSNALRKSPDANHKSKLPGIDLKTDEFWKANQKRMTTLVLQRFQDGVIGFLPEKNEPVRLSEIKYAYPDDLKIHVVFRVPIGNVMLATIVCTQPTEHAASVEYMVLNGVTMKMSGKPSVPMFTNFDLPIALAYSAAMGFVKQAEKEEKEVNDLADGFEKVDVKRDALEKGVYAPVKEEHAFDGAEDVD